MGTPVVHWNQYVFDRVDRLVLLTRKWNIVKNLPGGTSMWSPNQLFAHQSSRSLNGLVGITHPAITE